MAVSIGDELAPTSAERLTTISNALTTLRSAVPLPTDELHDAIYDALGKDRFSLSIHGGENTYLLSDKHNYDDYIVYYDQLCDPEFDIVAWLVSLKLHCYEDLIRTKSSFQPTWGGIANGASQPEYETDGPPDLLSCESSDEEISVSTSEEEIEDITPVATEEDVPSEGGIEDITPAGEIEDITPGEPYNSTDQLFCGGTSTNLPDIRSLQRQAARPKGSSRILPRALVVMVQIEGRPCRALLDSGSLTDFVSSTLVDQLKLKYDLLEKPIPLQLAVSGSRSVVKANTTVNLVYQDVSGPRTFDIANLEAYDVILGMPFLFQHQVLLGFNPPEIKIRSLEPLPIRGAQTQVLELKGSSPEMDLIESYRKELFGYAKDICKDAVDTPLPPLRAINHVIPLIDDDQVYAWRQSRCPEALRPLWRTKRDDYVRTGRWEFFSGTNTVPMIMMKKTTKDGSLKLRTVLDTRQRNKNTRKLASPLPDIDTILRNVSSHPYRSLLDGKDAYEQI